MANRWIGAALICGWLATATVAHAQYPGEPAPVGGPGCGPMGSPPIPGPMTTPYAPQGPEDGLGLPPNTPNASTPPGCCPSAECCPVAYISGEWLYWRFKNPKLPAPLVTTSLTGGTGFLDDPTAIVLLGEDGLTYDPYSGARITAGFWFDSSHVVALEGSGFYMERRDASFQFASDATGNPRIVLPFFDVTTNAESGFVIANPGTLFGGVGVTTSNRFWGAESNLVVNSPGCCVCGCTIGLSCFAGFRYLDFSERTNIEAFSTPVGGGNLTITNDQFRTTNQFYGGQFGTRLGISNGRLFLAGQAKIACGGLDAHSDTSGSTTTVNATPLPQTVPGGRFALPSNSGRYGLDRFTYVPEGEGRVGFQFTPNFSIWAGYTFMYWDRILRSTQQIDRNIDPTQLPPNAPNGQTFPQVLLEETTMWVQGINVGLEIIY